MFVGISHASRSALTFGLLLCATPALGQSVTRPAPPVTPAVRLAAPWRLAPASVERRAQPQPVSPTGRGTWQVELGAGAVLATSFGAGDGGQLPLPGTSFTTSTGGKTTRRVPSWAFGDGAVLLNDALALTPGAPAARLIPLDSVLTSTGAGGRIVVAGQFRVVRAVSPRLSIEVGLDAGQASYTVSQQTQDQIDITRASYVDAFQALFSDAAHFNPASSTSTVDYKMGGGYRAALTGAVRIHFGTPQKLRTYIVAGGGGMFMFGDGPAFTLTSNYNFTAPGFGTRIWSETDVLTARYHLPPARAVVLVGAGVSREFSRGRGIIIDGRVHISPGGVETVLETNPAHVSGGNAIISTSTNPSIQFSSQTSATLSSLQTRVTGFTSHGGSMAATTTLSVLYFIRY